MRTLKPKQATGAKDAHVPVPFEKLPDDAYVRQAQLVRGYQSKKAKKAKKPKEAKEPQPVVLPFSASTLWRLVGDGSFPKPIKFSERVTAWRVGDVRRWLAEQEAMTA